MTKKQRTGLIVGTIVVAIIAIITSLYYSRSFWVWRIKQKWGERFPFLLGENSEFETGYTNETWSNFTLVQLRRIYEVGYSTWFPEGSEEAQMAASAKRMEW